VDWILHLDFMMRLSYREFPIAMPNESISERLFLMKSRAILGGLGYTYRKSALSALQETPRA
jgi:hypothetical protein